MRIAHISDTHLGYRQFQLDERENDLYEAFEQAVDRAIEERADVFIHSGDLFDSPTPPIKALYVFKNLIRRVNDKMKFYCVLGDHDRPKRKGMPPHKLFDIRVLGVNELEWEEVNGVLIAGISNMRGKLAEILRQEMAKFDSIAEKYRNSILVAHQAIDKYLSFEGSYELKEDDLPRNASYLAFGHIHSRQIARFGKGFLAYAGATEILRRDEIPSWHKEGKGFLIVDFDGDEPEVEKVNLDIRPQFEVDVEYEKIDEILKLDFSRKPLLYVSIKGEKMDAGQIHEKLQELLKDRVLYFRYNLVDTSKPVPELPKGQIRMDELLRAHLKDERLVSLALELLGPLSRGEIEEAKEIANRYLEEVMK
ncbi:MAG: DNA repair exonuclease [Archaeoglobi archaeon]|nr:MAG: DNA repair exonuclease [Archaeoglobi archaeon]